MSFNPETLSRQLNENPAFQKHFRQDPQGTLKQMGLTVSNEVAATLSQQLAVNKSYVDDEILGCTRS